MLELGGFVKTMAPAAAAMILTVTLLIAAAAPAAYVSPLPVHVASQTQV